MNVAEEFLEAVEGKRIKCAHLRLNVSYFDSEVPDKDLEFNLKVGFTQEDLNEFLESCDVEYDRGYGAQELFGNIWCEDGTWFNRWEYDGSEGWEYQCCPEIPKHLLEVKQ